MTQKDKDLLFKDLCARLPYGVKLGFYAEATKHTYTYTLLGLEPQDDKPIIAKTDHGNFCMLADYIKPYLFPLSSMTEEQRKEFELISDLSYASAYGEEIVFSVKIIDWFNKNHFDYRGLIEKDLALDATGLNIY